MFARRRSLLLLLIVLLAACSSSGGTRRPTADRNLLTSAQIEGSGYIDVFSAVQALRPQWLQRRGATSINQRESIKVYLDDSLLGGVEALQQITTRSIASIRYMDGLEATQRWGLDHGQGAIMVFTRK